MSSHGRTGPKWVSAAQRLRTVRSACSEFLDRWAVSRLLAAPTGLDRVADDLKSMLDNAFLGDPSLDAALADPDNHDWSILYRGSVLDD